MEDLFSRIQKFVFREDLISQIFLTGEIKSSRKSILAKINPRENLSQQSNVHANL